MTSRTTTSRCPGGRQQRARNAAAAGDGAPQRSCSHFRETIQLPARSVAVDNRFVIVFDSALSRLGHPSTSQAPARRLNQLQTRWPTRVLGERLTQRPSWLIQLAPSWTRKRQYTLLILRCLFEGHVIEDKLADSAGSQSIISPARVDRVVTHTMNLPTTRSKLFAAKCGHTWHAYAVGSGEELERDLTWARQRLSVKERWAKPTTTKYVDDGQDSWLGAFTVSERDRFDLYQSMWPNEACDVRQNPLERPGVRSRNGKLSCLMAGMGIIFSPELGRWLIPIELWLTMGFPVTPAGVSRTGVVCQFSRGFPNAPRTRTRASQLKQIGNAIHVESVGSVLLKAFLKLAPLLRTRSKNAASSGCPCGPSCSKKQKR